MDEEYKNAVNQLSETNKSLIPIYADYDNSISELNIATQNFNNTEKEYLLLKKDIDAQNELYELNEKSIQNSRKQIAESEQRIKRLKDINEYEQKKINEGKQREQNLLNEIRALRKELGYPDDDDAENEEQPYEKPQAGGKSKKQTKKSITRQVRVHQGKRHQGV